MRIGLSAILFIGVFSIASCASRPAPSLGDVSANSETATGGADVGSTADFAQTAGDRVFFAYDQASLGSEARQVLQRQASWLQSHASVRVVIAGHCDERGTREYNLALGAQRAAATRDYLISLGVHGARVETVSYGKDRPLDARPSEEGWAVNRNAHTQLVNPPGG